MDFKAELDVYPLKTLRNLATVNPFYSNQIAMASPYDLHSARQSDHDIYEMIFTFPPVMWLITFLTLITFYAILKYGQWKISDKKDSDAGWVVFTYFIGVGDMNADSNFLKILLFNMTVFSFFLFQWLTGNMRTNLVSVSETVVVRSYQEILDRKVQPVWVSGRSANDIFEGAPDGSIEKEIWDWGQRKGNYLLERTAADGLKLLDAFMKLSNVLIVEDYLSGLIVNIFCKFATDPNFAATEIIKILMTPDKDKIRMTGFVYNPLIAPQLKRDFLKDKYIYEYLMSFSHV